MIDQMILMSSNVEQDFLGGRTGNDCISIQPSKKN